MGSLLLIKRLIIYTRSSCW